METIIFGTIIIAFGIGLLLFIRKISSKQKINTAIGINQYGNDDNEQQIISNWPFERCVINSETHVGNEYTVNFSCADSLSKAKLIISGTVRGVPRTASRTKDSIDENPTTITVTSPLNFDGEVIYTILGQIKGTWYRITGGEFI